MTPSERIREIANKWLVKGGKDWAELHRISGYIEGLEEGAEMLKRIADNVLRPKAERK